VDEEEHVIGDGSKERPDFLGEEVAPVRGDTDFSQTAHLDRWAKRKGSKGVFTTASIRYLSQSREKKTF
jgi:hypothetical protein